MKKAEDICKELHWTYDSDPGRYQLFEGLIKPAIKQAQLDAIEETVKLCAENAEADIVYHKGDYGYPTAEVCKASILNCADILKKELE